MLWKVEIKPKPNNKQIISLSSALCCHPHIHIFYSQPKTIRENKAYQYTYDVCLKICGGGWSKCVLDHNLSSHMMMLHFYFFFNQTWSFMRMITITLLAKNHILFILCENLKWKTYFAIYLHLKDSVMNILKAQNVDLTYYLTRR